MLHADQDCHKFGIKMSAVCNLYLPVPYHNLTTKEGQGGHSGNRWQYNHVCSPPHPPVHNNDSVPGGHGAWLQQYRYVSSELKRGLPKHHLTPGLRQMRGNLDCFGDIHKMKNSLRMEFCIFSCSITCIKHFDTQCIFTTALK